MSWLCPLLVPMQSFASLLCSRGVICCCCCCCCCLTFCSFSSVFAFSSFVGDGGAAAGPSPLSLLSLPLSSCLQAAASNEHIDHSQVCLPAHTGPHPPWPHLPSIPPPLSTTVVRKGCEGTMWNRKRSKLEDATTASPNLCFFHPYRALPQLKARRRDVTSFERPHISNSFPWRFPI